MSALLLLLAGALAEEVPSVSALPALPLPESTVPRSRWSRHEEGMKLVVHVVDDQHTPVPTAVVRIDDENLRHRVNHRTGRWMGRATYPQDRYPEPFREGRDVRLTVSAPGYLPRTVRYRFTATKNHVRVPLEPLDAQKRSAGAPTLDVATLLAATRPECAPGSQSPHTYRPAFEAWRPTASGGLALDPATLSRLTSLDDPDPWLTAAFSEHLLIQGPAHLDAALGWADIATVDAQTRSGDEYLALVHDLYRVRALAHHIRWQQWELTRIADPSRRNLQQVERSRGEAAAIATEWVQWAEAARQPTDLPAALCMAASDRPLDCTP